MKHSASRRKHWLLGLSWLLLASPALSQGGPLLAPANSRFTAWQAAQAQKATSASLIQAPDDQAYGYRPSPLDLSHLKGPMLTADQASIMAAGALPATYDLRLLGQVSAIRDQNPFGCCWAFGAMASMESSLRKAGKGAYDLAEWPMAWFAYNDFDSKLVAFTKAAVSAGQDSTFDQGGDDSMSTAILARGTGAAAEAASPYQNVKPYALASLPKGTEATVASLRECLFLCQSGSTFNAADAKAAITAYGGVAVGFYMDQLTAYSSINHTYRYTATTTPNHMVTLVGWDDTYSASKFPASNRPASNGAWIVRNNWGTAWGEAGYFYMAYDSHLDSAAVYLADPARNQKIYQYDPLGWIGNIGYGTTTAWCANVFTANGNTSITEVAFYAGAAATAYEITVRTAVTGTPATGTLALGPQTGQLDAAGYRRVVLANPVIVPNGSRFAIIVKLTTPGMNYPIPVEYPHAGWSDKATANAGESWASSDGAHWQDLTTSTANMNACIKAFGNSINTPRNDFDGDGRSDLLWRNASTGAVYLMPLSGATVLPGSVFYNEPRSAWQVVASGDFDGDAKADLLWWNSSTGQVYQMLMSGSSIKSGTMVYTEPDTAWRIIGTGDFDGDGRADILWRNTSTGAVYVMPMNGATVLPGAIVYTEPNPAWQIVAIADFDGDGRADLLWQNRSTGQVYQMLMNGTAIKSGAMVYVEPNSAWKIVAAADFTGAGMAAILWRNSSTGAVYLMPMIGAAVQPGSVICTEPNPDWQITALGDFDGDGKADLLWWNSSTGQVYQMLMNGAAIKAQAMIYVEPNSAWTLQVGK
jgi:C1A family cysteine protease